MLMQLIKYYNQFLFNECMFIKNGEFNEKYLIQYIAN